MITRWLLPLLALAGLALAVTVTARGARMPPDAAPVALPAQSAFATHVAGAGLIEARSENIAVAAPVGGLVTAVRVQAGQDVRAGDVLFELDARVPRAQLAVREAEEQAARAALGRLLALPRAEDVPPAEARASAARAVAEDARQQHAIARSLADSRAVSAEMLVVRSAAEARTAAELAAAEAELLRLRAGAWEPELAEARAALAAAQARVAEARAELDRLSVRAPVDGQVLRLNVRPGEYAVAGRLEPPLLLLGDVTRLHVRVDVDENDAWRVRAGARAQAFARGNPELSVELEFVRLEPWVLPKRSLTGDASERVDTRVLQVLFAFDRGQLPLYVGQQLDVFIEAGPPATAGAEATR